MRRLLTRIARAACKAADALTPHTDVAYERDVLHYLQDHRTTLEGDWRTAPQIQAVVGGDATTLYRALDTLKRRGFVEQRPHTPYDWRSRGVTATPGPRGPHGCLP